MSITGKGTKSIRKLPVAQSSITNVGFKVTRALHECSEDQTLIQLASLTAPSTAVNYSAPSPSELVKTNIFLFQDNVKLTSSLRGPLIKNLSWVPTGASTIKLLYNAEALEVLEILIDHNAKSSVTMVDADSTPISGTLAAGQTDFNLGNPFEVGKYPSQQHGMYIIYIDGQLAYRNTGNSAPGVGVTGDYYEVHAGAGLGTLIRLNSADLVNDRAISAIPSGALIERPNGSQMAVMEALQGQIDALVPTVAALAEVPETNFQGTPNQVDLKAFGDRVLTAESNITSQGSRITTVETNTLVLNMAYTNTGGQSIPNNTATDLTANWVMDYNTHPASFVAGVFTVPAGYGGKYQISGLAGFGPAGAPTAGAIWQLFGSKNAGAQTKTLGILSTQTGGATGLMVPGGVTDFQLNAGDTLKLAVFQNSNAAQTVGNATRVEIKRVGP